MEMTRETAEQSLRDIEETGKKARFSADWNGGDLILILWGVVWILAFLGTHFSPAQAGAFWLIGNAVGGIGTFAIIYSATQRVQSQEGQRVGFFWFATVIFIFMELAVMHPWNPVQMNAFICLQIMLAFVVVGLWMDLAGMIALGVAISGFTLIGYFLTGSYYSLWMACTSGVALLGSGLYARYRLKRS